MDKIVDDFDKGKFGLKEALRLYMGGRKIAGVGGDVILRQYCTKMAKKLEAKFGPTSDLNEFLLIPGNGYTAVTPVELQHTTQLPNVR